MSVAFHRLVLHRLDVFSHHQQRQEIQARVSNRNNNVDDNECHTAATLATHSYHERHRSTHDGLFCERITNAFKT